jgi:hypothetical protein
VPDPFPVISVFSEWEQQHPSLPQILELTLPPLLMMAIDSERGKRPWSEGPKRVLISEQ